MQGFGTPKLAMILPLDGRKTIHADLDKVKQALTEQGYYLQLPLRLKIYSRNTRRNRGINLINP